MFQANPFHGLLNLDLLYIVNNVLLIPLFLALCVVLRRGNRSLVALGLTTGLVGVAAYCSTNHSFEMLALRDHYFATTTDASRAAYLAAGEALLASYTGTGSMAYHILNWVALLLFVTVMFRRPAISGPTAWCGLLAHILVLVPSSAGIPGRVFAMASLAPWAGFSILTALRLRKLGAVTTGHAMLD